MVSPFHGLHFKVAVDSIVGRIEEYRDDITLGRVVIAFDYIVLDSFNGLSAETISFCAVNAVIYATDRLTIAIDHSVDISVKGRLRHIKVSVSV